MIAIVVRLREYRVILNKMDGLVRLYPELVRKISSKLVGRSMVFSTQKSWWREYYTARSLGKLLSFMTPEYAGRIKIFLTYQVSTEIANAVILQER